MAAIVAAPRERPVDANLPRMPLALPAPVAHAADHDRRRRVLTALPRRRRPVAGRRGVTLTWIVLATGSAACSRCRRRGADAGVLSGRAPPGEPVGRRAARDRAARHPARGVLGAGAAAGAVRDAARRPAVLLPAREGRALPPQPSPRGRRAPSPSRLRPRAGRPRRLERDPRRQHPQLLRRHHHRRRLPRRHAPRRGHVAGDHRARDSAGGRRLHRPPQRRLLARDARSCSTRCRGWPRSPAASSATSSSGRGSRTSLTCW